MSGEDEGVHVPRRIRVLTYDTVGPQLTGSAVRALELARALAGAGHQPVVIAPALLDGAERYPFPVQAFDSNAVRSTLLPKLSDAEAIVLPLDALVRTPELAACTAPLVFDIYDPFIFELLTSGVGRGLDERRREILAHGSVVNHVLRRGDFFICASERQRDLWLGALLANNRLLPSADSDLSFRRLIDVVPIGLPEGPPSTVPREPAVLRKLLPGIAPGDKIIVSGGALWDWQDPVTAIRAIARISSRRSDIHLVFFAGAMPGANRPPTAAAISARETARELGVRGQQVHFLEGWVPYAQRGEYLAGCDAGITTHRPGIESHFSFRTRVLDYLWAGLPVVCTEGDVLADLVARHELGIVVRPQDDAALADAFERIADDGAFEDACRARIAAVRPSLAWRVAAAPLIRFCDDPRHSERSPKGLAAARQLAAAAWKVLRSEGVRGAARRIHRHGFLRI